MVYYKENSDLKQLKTVITVKGDVEYRKNTKFLGQKYHTINRDCFQINEKWHSIDSGNVVYDNEKEVYTLKSYNRDLVNGIIINKKGELERGWFTRNHYQNVWTISQNFGELFAINSDILEKSKWFEDLGGNTWYNSDDMPSASKRSRLVIRNERNYQDRGYNIEECNDFEMKKDLYEKYPTEISLKAREMSKYLGDLSFGVELELHAGNIGENLRSRHGAVVCRDGSLNGGAEIVTVPLKGAKGLQTTVNLANDLKDRGEIGLDCSLHIHFGNLNVDKLSVIALYRLCKNIQNELFTMFPYYKTIPDGIKAKNYTKKLTKLNISALRDKSKEAYECYLLDSWIKLFDFYSEGRISINEFDKRTREHPIQRKWERKNRYFYMNFLNLFFGHRHTVESRLHSGTLNSHKIINWLFINVAIIKYAQRYSKELIMSDRNISLKEVLDIYPTMFPKDAKARTLSKYLFKYFEERQARCMKDLEKNDHTSMWDISEDKDYSFEYDGIKGLI